LILFKNNLDGGLDINSEIPYYIVVIRNPNQTPTTMSKYYEQMWQSLYENETQRSNERARIFGAMITYFNHYRNELRPEERTNHAFTLLEREFENMSNSYESIHKP
jgi:hypothetical protein